MGGTEGERSTESRLEKEAKGPDGEIPPAQSKVNTETPPKKQDIPPTEEAEDSDNQQHLGGTEGERSAEFGFEKEAKGPDGKTPPEQSKSINTETPPKKQDIPPTEEAEDSDNQQQHLGDTDGERSAESGLEKEAKGPDGETPPEQSKVNTETPPKKQDIPPTEEAEDSDNQQHLGGTEGEKSAESGLEKEAKGPDGETPPEQSKVNTETPPKKQDTPPTVEAEDSDNQQHPGGTDGERSAESGLEKETKGSDGEIPPAQSKVNTETPPKKQDIPPTEEAEDSDNQQQHLGDTDGERSAESGLEKEAKGPDGETPPEQSKVNTETAPKKQDIPPTEETEDSDTQQQHPGGTEGERSAEFGLEKELADTDDKIRTEPPEQQKGETVPPVEPSLPPQTPPTSEVELASGISKPLSFDNCQITYSVELAPSLDTQAPEFVSRVMISMKDCDFNASVHPPLRSAEALTKGITLSQTVQALMSDSFFQALSGDNEKTFQVSIEVAPSTGLVHKAPVKIAKFSASVNGVILDSVVCRALADSTFIVDSAPVNHVSTPLLLTDSSSQYCYSPLGTTAIEIRSLPEEQVCRASDQELTLDLDGYALAAQTKPADIQPELGDTIELYTVLDSQPVIDSQPGVLQPQSVDQSEIPAANATTSIDYVSLKTTELPPVEQAEESDDSCSENPPEDTDLSVEDTPAAATESDAVNYLPSSAAGILSQPSYLPVSEPKTYNLRKTEAGFELCFTPQEQGTPVTPGSLARYDENQSEEICLIVEQTSDFPDNLRSLLSDDTSRVLNRDDSVCRTAVTLNELLCRPLGSNASIDALASPHYVPLWPTKPLISGGSEDASETPAEPLEPTVQEKELQLQDAPPTEKSDKPDAQQQLDDTGKEQTAASDLGKESKGPDGETPPEPSELIDPEKEPQPQDAPPSEILAVNATTSIDYVSLKTTDLPLVEQAEESDDTCSENPPEGTDLSVEGTPAAAAEPDAINYLPSSSAGVLSQPSYLPVSEPQTYNLRKTEAGFELCFTPQEQGTSVTPGSLARYDENQSEEICLIVEQTSDFPDNLRSLLSDDTSRVLNRDDSVCRTAVTLNELLCRPLGSNASIDATSSPHYLPLQITESPIQALSEEGIDGACSTEDDPKTAADGIFEAEQRTEDSDKSIPPKVDGADEIAITDPDEVSCQPLSTGPLQTGTLSPPYLAVTKPQAYSLRETETGFELCFFSQEKGADTATESLTIYDDTEPKELCLVYDQNAFNHPADLRSLITDNISPIFKLDDSICRTTTALNELLCEPLRANASIDALALPHYVPLWPTKPLISSGSEDASKTCQIEATSETTLEQSTLEVPVITDIANEPQIRKVQPESISHHIDDKTGNAVFEFNYSEPLSWSTVDSGNTSPELLFTMDDTTYRAPLSSMTDHQLAFSTQVSTANTGLSRLCLSHIDLHEHSMSGEGTDSIVPVISGNCQVLLNNSDWPTVISVEKYHLQDHAVLFYSMPIGQEWDISLSSPDDTVKLSTHDGFNDNPEPLASTLGKVTQKEGSIEAQLSFSGIKPLTVASNWLSLEASHDHVKYSQQYELGHNLPSHFYRFDRWSSINSGSIDSMTFRYTIDNTLTAERPVTGISLDSHHAINGLSLSLDGGGISNDAISEVLSKTTDFTVCSWLSTTVAGSSIDDPKVNPALLGDSHFPALHLFSIDSTGRVGIAINNIYGMKSNAPVNDGSLHHICMTSYGEHSINRTWSKTQMYVDGQLQKSNPVDVTRYDEDMTDLTSDIDPLDLFRTRTNTLGSVIDGQSENLFTGHIDNFNISPIRRNSASIAEEYTQSGHLLLDHDTPIPLGTAFSHLHTELPNQLDDLYLSFKGLRRFEGPIANFECEYRSEGETYTVDFSHGEAKELNFLDIDSFETMVCSSADSDIQQAVIRIDKHLENLNSEGNPAALLHLTKTAPITTTQIPFHTGSEQQGIDDISDTTPTTDFFIAESGSHQINTGIDDITVLDNLSALAKSLQGSSDLCLHEVLCQSLSISPTDDKLLTFEFNSLELNENDQTEARSSEIQSSETLSIETLTSHQPILISMHHDTIEFDPVMCQNS
ncbi:hypothetical protein EOPP23_18220 [Endozoicomonas sp. OPT23]|nr:hypothetical protein [Endozoicomonas sp. OPT23]